MTNMKNVESIKARRDIDLARVSETYHREMRAYRTQMGARTTGVIKFGHYLGNLYHIFSHVIDSGEIALRRNRM